MQENVIKMIVDDYIDGAGHQEGPGEPYYPYLYPVQIDEIQLSKLYYLCQVLSAHAEEFSWRIFQGALDMALDEYCEWSGKSDQQAYAEMSRVQDQLEQQGYFEEIRRRGYVTGPEHEDSEDS